MDSVAIIADSLLEALEETGLPEVDYETAKSVIGLPLVEALEILTPGATQEERDNLMKSYKKFFVEKANSSLKPFRGVHEALLQLKERGVVLAIATGKSRAGLERDFERCGLRGLFFTTRTIDECNAKPDPQMIFDILKETQMKPEQAIMVGDTAYDLEMARNAGVDSVASAYGAHPVHLLQPFEPAGLFDDYQSLHRWLLTRV